MKVVVVLNGLPAKSRKFYRRFYAGLCDGNDVEVLRTEFSGHGVQLADQAVRAGCDAVIAAGGDGTLHEVINGVLAGREDVPVLPMIGVIPLGNGNDFARLLGIQGTNVVRLGMRAAGKRIVDVGKIRCADADGRPQIRYFINIADVGAGPDVVRRVQRFGRMKSWRFAYYLGVIVSMLRHRIEEIHAETDQWSWEGRCRSFAVANGRSHGHGLYVAPDAKIDDGILDCFIAGPLSVITFMLKTRRLMKALYIRHPQVAYRKARQIDLASGQQCLLQADGELVGYLPARFDVLAGRLRFIV